MGTKKPAKTSTRKTKKLSLNKQTLRDLSLRGKGPQAGRRPGTGFPETSMNCPVTIIALPRCI